MHVLLVEDEPDVAQFIAKGLTHEGFTLDIAPDGRAAQERLRAGTAYDLLIFDVNLPHVSGFELCRAARAARPDVPILLLTALDSLADKETGFGAGADDYLAKPFAFRELLLRARALTRRHAEAERQTLRIADLDLDLDAQTVTRAGRRIELMAREYRLLRYLLLHQRRIVSRLDISEAVWDSLDTNTNVVDVYISHLRRKIDRDHPVKLIHTVVGMGYVLRED